MKKCLLMFSVLLGVLVLAVASGNRQNRELRQGSTNGESPVNSEHQMNTGPQIVGKTLPNGQAMVIGKSLAENLFVSLVGRDTMR
ncbi:MAG TPA: hypothetical protein VFM69_03965 [Pricia sp.]|nr:hypothetical protein [Pricia sp.]